MDQAEHDVVPDNDRAAVEAFFECVKAVADAECLGTMIPALQRRLQQPPTALLSAVLEQELTDEQARQLLFFPEPADMALYPKLLAGDPACPTDLSSSAANKAQAAVLGHLFLVHGRSWQRLRPFIEAGGLRSLVSLLGHPNRLLASQVLQLLLLATHPDMYDWHSPPDHNSSSSSSSQSQQQQEPQALAEGTPSNSLETAISSEGTASVSKQAAADAAGEEAQLHNPEAPAAAASHPSQGPDRQLWLQLLALHEGPLLPRLLALSPDAWPGSGQQALQLLAFCLSWLRACWSQGGVLQLSPGLLSGLAAWSARSTASSEERQLAAALVKDFGAAGPAPAAAAAAAAGSAVEDASAATNGSSDAECIGVVGFEPAIECRVVADRTQINSSPGSEAAMLKAAGNDAFKTRDWATAIRLYSAALDVPVPSQALLGEAPRRAVYHTNRAAAYLERVWELQAAAAAAREAADTNGDDVHNTKKLIVELDLEATALASSSSSSKQPSSWLEAGGSLDGMQLDSSPDSLAKQLEAAVLDCRAVLQLVPQHAKAHYRLATALRAQGNLPQALAAAAAAEQHAPNAADAAAAARLAAAIKEQQQQGDAQPRVSAAVAAGKPAGSQTTIEPSRVASASDQSSSSNTAGRSMPPSSSANSQTAVDPLGQLLQQFAAAVGTNAAAGAAVRPAKACGNKAPAAAGALEIKTPAAAAAAAAGGSSMIGSGEEGLTSIKLPQKQQGKKSAAAGKVLVQVLASSHDEQACDTAAAAAAAATGEAVGVAAAGGVPVQPRNAGFIIQEVASSKTSKGVAGMRGSC